MPKLYSYTRIATLSVAGLATQVASGPVTLHRVVFNSATTVFTVGLIDGTSGSTVNVGTIRTATLGLVTPDKEYNIRLATGLRVITTGVTSALPDITVVYSK